MLLPVILLRVLVNLDLDGLPVFHKYVHLAEHLTGSGNSPFHSSPVYTAWLYGLKIILGLDTGIICRLQGLIGIVSIILLVRIVAILYGRNAAVASGWIYGLCIPVIIYESDLVTTSIDVFTQAACMYTLLRAGGRSRRIYWLIPGMWMGLAVGLRPTMLLALPVLVAASLLSLRNKWRLSVTDPAGLAWFAAGLILAVSPITIINFLRSGEPVLVTASGGAVFYSSNNYRATGLGYSPPPSLTEIENEWMRENQVEKPVEHSIFRYLAERAAGKHLSNREVSAFYRSEAWRFLGRDPQRSIRLWIKKLLYLLNDYEVLDTGSLVLRGEAIRKFPPVLPATGLILVAGIFGLSRVRWSDRRVWIILSFVMAHAVTGVAFYVNGRLRVPMTYCLAVFAGTGVCGLVTMIRKRSPEVWLSLFGLMGLIALTTWRDEVIRRHSEIETPSFLYQTKGLAALNSGNFGAAEIAFRQAVAANPMEAREAWVNLAEIFRKRGDNQNESVCRIRAAGTWTREELQMLRSDGFLTAYEYDMATARALWKDDNRMAAEKLFRECTSLYPDYPDPWFNSAYIESLEPDPDWRQVMDDCDRALERSMKFDRESTRARRLQLQALQKLNPRGTDTQIADQIRWESSLVFSP